MGRVVKIVGLAAAATAVVVALVLGIRACENQAEKYHKQPNYLDVVFGAKHMAESASSANNFRLIRDGLERYLQAFGEYPLKLQDLVDNGLLPSAALYPPNHPDQPYGYVSGQDETMSPENILVYEEQPVHRDKCNVLRLDGRIETLTPEALKANLAETRRRMEAE